MDWLYSVDVALFRFINSSLSNPLFDKLMPLASDTPGFIPLVIVALVVLAWKGGTRGRICALLLLVTVGLGDGWICNTIKHAVQRPRPFMVLEHVNMHVGYGSSGSMPSSHAANWFSATMVLFIYYRRSWRFMLPLALLVSVSRVYNGVHYPSDVLTGMILGAGYGAAFVWAANALWQWMGRRGFPIWWQRLPSLIYPEARDAQPALANASSIEQHWLRLGYLLICVLLLANLFYIASGKIELSEDEAYQWTWSKHLALSYYSKPLLIAVVQFLGTHLWGDTAFGVRFFSPVITAALSLLVLRFLTKEAGAKAGVASILILSATPLLGVGSILMTIDPLSVLFWTLAMLAGWRAVAANGSTRDWLWTGLWMGLGTLSKYTNLFQYLCWLLFFVLSAEARKQLRKPGPYLAVLINLICALPIVIWNGQHNWITFQHVANDGKLGEGWHPKILDFLAAEFALLNPVFFVAIMAAAILFWRGRDRKPLHLFLFSMGAPVFLFYLVFSLHSNVLPNWIAPSVVPLFCLMIIYWNGFVRQGRVKFLLWTGIFLGIFAVVIMHDTNLISKIFKRTLPPKVDPLRRVLAWRATGDAVQKKFTGMQQESKPAFIICEHYGTTGELSFYMPEARKTAGDAKPLVYYLAKDKPDNQFFFWPNYLDRKGENAMFVQQLDEPKMIKGWLSKWWGGQQALQVTPEPTTKVPPPELQKQFTSVKDLGVLSVEYRGRVYRHVQVFECLGLK